MADNDVGGIGVKFTADAAQLKQELTSLEQRLRSFNEAHGQTKVKLQASLVMPGNRVLADFRRDIEKSFQSQGAAGPIKARIQLLPPTATQIKELTGSIGDIKVKVVGSFEWAAGKAPPKSVTVKVVEEGGSTRRPGTVSQTQATAQAAGSQAPARRSAARRRSSVVEQTTWTQADLDLFSLDALRDQLVGASRADKRIISNAIAQREREGRTNVGGYTAGGYKASTGPGGGGARGLTGGMTGAYGRGAPAVRHWSQGPVSSVPAGPTIAAMGRRGEFPMPMRNIYNPYPPKGAPEPPSYGPSDLGKNPQLTEASLTRRLRQIVKTLSPEAMQAGTGWYQRAGEIAQGIGAKSGLGRSQVAGVTAAFSQNAGWSENVRNAQDFFEAFRRGARTVAEVESHVANIRKDLSFNALGLTGRTQQALNVATGPANAETTLRGPKGDKNPKIAAFYRALMGDPTSFTVDRHMALMMSGGTIGSQQKMHTPFQRAGQRVAGEMGVSAADLQAMVWTHALGPKFAGADPYEQMRATGGAVGGARGFAQPLQLSSRGPFARGYEPPVEHVPTRALLPFRELDREKEPRLTGRGDDYLADLTGKIRNEGIKEPLTLWYDKAGFAQLTDGNHRLAAAMRLLNEGVEQFAHVPVRAEPAPEGVLLGGNVRRPATPGATTARGIVGGARGFAAGGGGDDPYNQNILREQRASGRKANAIKAQAREAADRARADEVNRKWAEKGANLTPDEAALRNVEMREAGIGEPLGPGGQIPLGLPGLGARIPAGTAAGRVRAAAPPTTGHQLPLRWPSPEPGHGPASGIITGLDPRQQMFGRGNLPAMETIHGEMGLTGRGIHAAGVPQALADFGTPRVRDTGTGSFKPATPAQLQQALRPLPQPPGNLTNLDSPAYLRKQADAIGQGVAQAMAAEPPIAAGPTLQDFLDTPPAGGGGGGGRPPTAAGGFMGGGGPGDDVVGQPSPSGFVQQMLATSAQGRIAIQEARQAGQIRAVGTTVASQLGGLLGRGVDVDKINRMTATLTKLEHVVRDNAGAFEELEAKRAKFGEGSDEFKDFDKTLEPARKQMRGLVDEFDALQPNKFAQMATGLAASIGGTVIGLGLFQGVTVGLSLAGDALGEVIERTTGYNNIANKTTAALSDQTRALNGWVEGAIAAQSATTGMSDAMAEFVQQNLQSRVAGQAANKNLEEQNNLFQSALAVRRQVGQLPSGVDQSAISTTGGLNIFGVQTPLFGTPSAQELMGRQLGGERFADISTFNPAAFGQQALRGDFIGATSAAQSRNRLPGSATGLGSIVTGLTTAFAGLVNPEEAAKAQGENAVLTLEGVDPKQIRDFVDTVDLMNEALGRAGDEGLRFKGNVEDLTVAQAKAGQAQAKRQADLAREGGAGFLANAIQQGGGRLLLRGLSGNRAQQIEQIQQTAAQYQRGALMPNQAQAAFQQARGISAQLQLNQAQGQLQRESIIPGQSFLRQLFAGRAPNGRDVNIRNPLQAGTAGLPPDVLRGGLLGGQSIDTSQLTAGLGQVETQANKGRDALVGMIKSADSINRTAGVPSNLLQQFNSLTEAAGKTAATIRSIGQASAWMQVNLQVKQINEQIFLMSRSLEDARSFLSGAGEGELGLLQHRARGLEIAQAELGFRQQSLSLANQELGIAASTLQLQQRQRQINFQRAIAGFVTPGQTPEEIAARQKEAGLEADFAQKGQDIAVTQLDNQRESVALQRESLGISKEQFAVQQAMVTVSAERAIGDLGRAIGLLQEQARVTVQLQVNSEAIAAYQEVLEEQKAQIESVITEAYNTQQTILTKSAELIATYSGTITTWQSMLLTQLGNYVTGATAIFAGLSAGFGAGVGTTGNVSGRDPDIDELAGGFYGNVTGAKHMVVGEAGTETVAVLRNPRSMMMQTGGGDSGGVNINITVTGNNVGSQQDADELAAVIARKVEESMSRRTSLLGMRSN